MNEQQLYAGMGSLSDLMTDTPIVDLSWLEVVPGSFQNIPTGNNPNNVIPQLQEAWSMENLSNPSAFIPNTAAPGKVEVHEVGEDMVAPVVLVAKKAMMLGLKGDKVLHYLRDRFPTSQLRASREALSKVASEQGLLGTVYVDLSAFETAKEAARFLGPARLRLASCAIGTPSRDVNYVTDSGNVREMNLPHVAQVEYTPELLNHYASLLADEGLIEKGAKVANKEDLRQAVIAGRKETVRERTLEARPFQAADATSSYKLLDKHNAYLKEASARRAAEVRLRGARPILASMQSEMLRGRMGPALREVMASRFPESTLVEYAPEISKLASLQGLMGRLYADVALYSSADEAIVAIRNASVRPNYIVDTSKTPGLLSRVASATGCVPMPETGPSVLEASTLVRSLLASDKISAKVASDLVARLDAGSPVTNVIRDAHLASATYVPEARTGGVMATEHSLLSAVEVNGADEPSVRLAAQQALASGISYDRVLRKVAGLVSPGRAMSLVRAAIGGLDVVPATSMDRCSFDTYSLKRGAKIASARKCANCVLNVGGFCGKQATQLEGKEAQVRKASTEASVDPAVAYQVKKAYVRAETRTDVLAHRMPPETRYDMDGLNAFFGVKVI